MAEASVAVIGKEKVLVERDIEGVMLALTRDEAGALHAVLGAVGGDPLESRRGLIVGIASALEDNAEVYDDGSDTIGYVYFRDRS